MIRNLEQNNILVGMVSETQSFLGENSDYILRTTIEREACPNNLAPTTSTTLQLIMGDALAMSLVDLRHFTPSDYAKYHPGGALGKRLYLHVGDLVDLQRAPHVTETETIRPIIIEMTSNRLGATAVLDPQGQVTGIITDGDLRRMLQKEQDITQVKACDIMSRNPRSIDIHEMAVAALRLMEKSKITQLIATEEGKYVGMIHMHDILKEGIV
jgi:arabinose-5-phosphate isomerase